MAQQAFAGSDGKVKQLSDLVQDCMKSNADKMVVEFGPVFGQLNAQSLADFDEDTKIMVVALTKQISSIPIAERTFQKITSLCSQSPMIEAAGPGTSKADSLIKKDIAEWKTDGSPSDAIVKEVNAWYHKLVENPDILEGASVDIDVLGRVVAQSGATVEDLKTIFVKREQSEKNLDVAGIIYPQPEKPIFRLFRIHLTAWSDSDRTLMLQSDQNGITGEVYVTEYQPRKSVMESLTPAARAKASEMAAAFFA